jgi:uncharacterized protein (TIGR04255 family)
LLTLGALIPAIQEQMRKAGYPDFVQSAHISFNLGVAAAAGEVVSPPVPQQLQQYVFDDLKGQNGFILWQGSLSFRTVAYESNEVFQDAFVRGLEILNAAAGGLAFSDRIGIRFVNAVQPSAPNAFPEFLANEVIGLGGKVENSERVYSFSESLLTRADVGQVVARAIIQSGQLGYPPDLIGERLQLLDRFKTIVGEHAVLDIDGWSDDRRPFDIQELRGRLEKLHGFVEECFLNISTTRALSVWNS